jgi:hypothetical protein
VHGSTKTGWHVLDAGWKFSGAQALVFPAPAVRTMLAHPTPLNHTRLGIGNGRNHIDAVVGLWAQRAGLPLIVPSPSLADHIGATSALGHGRLEGRPRIAWKFPGEESELSVMFPHGLTVSGREAVRDAGDS